MDLTGDDLAAMLGDDADPSQALAEAHEEDDDEAAEPVAESQPADANEADTEDEEKTPDEGTEERKWPRGVFKKLQKEVALQAEIQAEISTAKAKTKALKAELESLTTKGSEPVKQTEVDTDPEPNEPDIDTFEGTNPEFQAATKKWKQDWRAWNTRQTEAVVGKQFEARQRQQAVDAEISKARERHGEAFEANRTALAAAAPPELQMDISAMEDWSALVNHLGANPKELAEIVAAHKQSPHRAIAALTRLQDRLATAEAEASAEPPVRKSKIPPPTRPQGGGAAAAVSIDLDKADPATFNRHVRKMLASA